MTFRPAFVAAAVALAAFASGCAASDASAEEVEESADELSTTTLRDITIVKGSMTEAGTITVAYEPSLYTPSRHVPFLAVELPAEAVRESANLRPMNGPTAPLSVNVAGDFPGAPRVLVTDENFRVLAGTRAVSTENGEEASLALNTRPGKKLVLVRDMLWVKPMTFTVSVGR
jgi:hypothetical protein